jgi:ABC-type transport system substrate-binding protein
MGRQAQGSAGGDPAGPTRRGLLAAGALSLAWACAAPGGNGRRPAPVAPVAPAATGTRRGARAVLRLPARMRVDAGARISPLAYGGGFDIKTGVYETLVRMGPDGRRVPGLAQAWHISPDGLEYTLELCPGGTFHDGSPADAEAVRLHLRRWVGLPEHGWLLSSDAIESVSALAPDVLRIRLNRPRDLLGDLLCINPCGISAPGMLDRKGDFVRPLGSGSLRFVEAREDGRVLRCSHGRAGSPRAEDEPLIEFAVYTSADSRRPLDDLLAQESSQSLDAVIDNWSETIPRDRLSAAQADPRFRLTRGPGGSVVFLAFRCATGPSSDPALRSRARAALDRGALIQRAMLGFARPCDTWAPPTVAHWPQSRIEPASSAGSFALQRLRVPRAARTPEDSEDQRLHEELARQCRAAGIELEVESLPEEALAQRLAAGAWDALVMRTLGVPYDPAISLTRFLPATGRPFADSRLRLTGDGELTALAAAAAQAPSEAARLDAYARVQAHIDREASVIPLYVPERLALRRRDLGEPRLDHDTYRVDVAGLLGRP